MKKGDKLRCHTDLVMDDGTTSNKKGNVYTIKELSKRSFTIIDDGGDSHWFDIQGDEPYTLWFELIEDFQYGEEVEVSTNGIGWLKRTFLCVAPNGRYVVWSEDYPILCEYCRKVN